MNINKNAQSVAGAGEKSAGFRPDTLLIKRVGEREMICDIFRFTFIARLTIKKQFRGARQVQLEEAEKSDSIFYFFIIRSHLLFAYQLLSIFHSQIVCFVLACIRLSGRS